MNSKRFVRNREEGDEAAGVEESKESYDCQEGGKRVRENGELRGGKKKDQDQTRPDRRDQTRRSRLGWANKAGVSADTGAQCALELCARGQKPMRVRCPGAAQPLLRAFRYLSQ